MSTFPLLASGSVMQYPAPVTSGQGAQTIRFLDGSDQRYLIQRKPLRQWQIRLDLLNDEEIQQLETFFGAQNADYSAFTFPDPFSGTDVPNCRFGEPQLLTEYVATGLHSTSIWVIETYG
ncbi:MAG: hypothetical protein ACRD34_10615 [Bryobacteraceae bacterium]